jgi:cytochrome c556
MRAKIAAAITAISVGLAGAAVGMDSQQPIADPIPARQEIMKENSAAMRAASNLAKGEVPYNEAEAAGAMAIIKDNMEVFPTLFPEDSMEGETRALAAIWENKEAFEAEAAKLSADAAAAEEAAAQGQEAFAAALQEVGANCGGCHENFRGPAS